MIDKNTIYIVQSVNPLNIVVMIQKCSFRPDADILETQPGLSQSIPDSIDYGSIKDTSCPASYNGQKDLAEVGNRIHEPFDVIEFDRTYTRIRKQINDAEYEKSKESK